MLGKSIYSPFRRIVEKEGILDTYSDKFVINLYRWGVDEKDIQSNCIVGQKFSNINRIVSMKIKDLMWVVFTKHWYNHGLQYISEISYSLAEHIFKNSIVHGPDYITSKLRYAINSVLEDITNDIKVEFEGAITHEVISALNLIKTHNAIGRVKSNLYN